MKALLILLVSIPFMPIYTDSLAQSFEETSVLNTAIVMFANECGQEVTSELIAFGEITYLYLYKYYTPNLFQVYCFGLEDNYPREVFDFIMKYNDYVVFIFEDDLWFNLAPGIAETEGIDFTIEDAETSEGLAYMNTAIVFAHFYNQKEDPNAYIDTEDWNSITITHELAHLILHDYGYNEEVYVDWVHAKDTFYNEYTTGDEIYSPLTAKWYEVFEKYPVEDDF